MYVCMYEDFKTKHWILSSKVDKGVSKGLSHPRFLERPNASAAILLAKILQLTFRALILRQRKKSCVHNGFSFKSERTLLSRASFAEQRDKVCLAG